MTFNKLSELQIENRVLRNVELSDGSAKAELDAVVLTPKSVWIVEIKNTKKNIFIDEHGQYYRTGEYLRWDSDIGYKMRMKSELLAKLLKNEGYEVPIKCIVLFSNNRIEVQNKYKQLTTCFLSQLNTLIEENIGETVLKTMDINVLATKIDSIVGTDTFPIKTDIEKMKRDYATLMAKLEIADELVSTTDDEPDIIQHQEASEMYDITSRRKSFLEWVGGITRNLYVRASAGSIAAGLAILIKTAIKRL